MRVVVVGAGIAGLGAAYELRKRGVEVVVLEAAEEVGGRCRSFEWHGSWRHTAAEALIASESSLTALRGELAREGAPSSIDLDDWATVHGERIYRAGNVVNPLSIAGLRRLSGFAPRNARFASLLPAMVRQRRRHDPDDLTCTLWADEDDAASWFRQRSPRLFDHLIEPFMQFSTLESGDYSMAWLMFFLGDLGWLRKGWWVYDERRAGGVTYELGRVLADDEGCELVLGAGVEKISRLGDEFLVQSRRNGVASQLRADAVLIAVPGSEVLALAGDLLDDAHAQFFAGVDYAPHHIARYLVHSESNLRAAKTLLPSAEGFARLSKVTIEPAGTGAAIVIANIKGSYARTVTDEREDVAMAEAWEEAVRAFPELGSAVIDDQVLTRNDIGLCRRPAGFVRRLAAFLALPPVPGVTFAGDYLLNSTVGGAHRTGVRAANQILRDFGIASPLDAEVRDRAGASLSDRSTTQRTG
jgi:oxygen-dependent protoporphyrinogen oxidase